MTHSQSAVMLSECAVHSQGIMDELVLRVIFFFKLCSFGHSSLDNDDPLWTYIVLMPLLLLSEPPFARIVGNCGTCEKAPKERCFFCLLGHGSVMSHVYFATLY